MSATAVIGRDEELAAVREFVSRLGAGPSSLVIAGEAGIGKTTLWELGLAATQGSAQVLAHRSVQAESSLAFVGLSDLLGPVFDQVAPSLFPPRREALEVALLMAAPGDEPPDPRAIGLALLDVLTQLAEDGSVLVALDDLQWLDPSSAAVLQIALRRIRSEPVSLLATQRREAQSPAAPELDDAFPEERRERLWLDPLSLAGLYRLLKERVGIELTRPQLARVSEVSGGNPFFALEIGRELAREDSPRPAGEFLSVPASLRELLGGRLARLPAVTSGLLLQAAALARPTTDALAAARDDQNDVQEALVPAVRAGVVNLDGKRLRFAHPLLASICYERASDSERRAAHRALAAVVDDTEERARHSALATERPDARVASDLDQAAARAAARGAPAAAAELCELAAESTPATDARARGRRLRAAALHGLAGEGERASLILRELLEEASSGGERADVLLALASTFRANPATMIELCGEALAEAEGDHRRSAEILALRSWAHMFDLNVRAALADARASLDKAERADDPRLVTQAIARVGQLETWGVDITPRLLERGVEIEREIGARLGYRGSPRLPLSRLLMRLGEVERPRTLLGELESEAVERGDEGTRVVVLWSLSMLEWMVGRWQVALEHAVAANELAEQTQDAHTRAWVGRVKALVEGDLGLVEEARLSAAEGMAFSRASSNEMFLIAAQGSLGRLELALGNLEQAGALLDDLPRRLQAAHLCDPTVPIWPDAIETLVGLRELGPAAAYLEQYEANARGLGGPWALAAAARCRGLVAAGRGEFETAFKAFELALGELADQPYPMERARTLFCLGSARLQANQRRLAREALEQAVAGFEELGATLWLEKARGELRRISGRRAAPDDLTETERRVAGLAAEGHSNKEIAATLFMGVSTVESHLSRVYRKLGIRSRAQLASRLVEPAKRTGADPQT
jgi:DNA-binding CsgD family transcriptional regulator